MAEKKGTHIKKDILTRVRWLYVLFSLVGVAIVVKIIYTQFGPESERLKELATEISYYRDTLMAQRGDILASDGRVLATTIPKYELRMDFAAEGVSDSVFYAEAGALAEKLSRFFYNPQSPRNRSAAEYKKILTDARKDKFKNRYLRIAPRWVDYWELGEVRKFPIFKRPNSGFIAEPKDVRINPQGSLAYRTVGFVNETGTKVGIEGSFDEQLRGKNGTTLMQKVTGRVRVPVPDAANVEPKNGVNVVTTIDIDLQDVAEKALKSQIAKEDADWGSVVLMEVSTGRIKAMSNITRDSKGNLDEVFNYAIGRAMDPGSTFKLATLIALIEKGGLTLDDKVNTGSGRNVNIGGAIVTDDHKDMGVIDLRTAFEMSSNVAFSKLAYDHFNSNPSVFVDEIRSLVEFPLGMQVMGEAAPVIWKPGDRWWSKIALQKMAYGYGLNLTAMHTLMLYNAVANDGKMVRPLLVTELQQYGNTVQEYRTEVVNEKICSDKTLGMVQECMEGVVEKGTGGVLRNPYYKVAAKTGTAWVTENRRGYLANNYLATLVGYFPADVPKYSCIVVMKTSARGRAYYGAALAGPVFRAVADRVYGSHADWQLAVDEKYEKNDIRPAVKSGRTDEIRKAVQKLNYPFDAPKNIGKWAAVVDSLDRKVELMPGVAGAGSVPSVVGMGLKDAIYMLEGCGLKVAFRGAGTVVSQSVAAGEPVRRGDVVTLELNCQ